MTMIKDPVTIVCQYDDQDNIVPVKYRITSRQGVAKTYPILEVKEVHYGKYEGDLSISYTCIAAVEQDKIDCVVRFNTELGKWDLFVA